MFKAMMAHIIAIPVFAWQLLIAVPAEGWRQTWKRIPIFILTWILFSLFNCFHLVGHIIDELIFFPYRKISVKQPVFILGIPRSGTTYLQRLLANNEKLTTFTVWEALLAPSLTEKYFYYGLGKLLFPFEKLLLTFRQKLLHKMDEIHQIKLNEPEEDFVLLMPVLACFLLVFMCPRSRHFWSLGQFDNTASPAYKKMVLTYYYRCLQKHLFFHGQELTVLSKNPSFTSWIDSLHRRFPDARIIACHRNPIQAIPSQLSSLRPVMSILGNGDLSGKTQSRIIDLLYHYYTCLGEAQQSSLILQVDMSSLQNNLKDCMSKILEFANINPSHEFMNIIDTADISSRNYKSKHQYKLDEFSLSEKILDDRFQTVWPLSDKLSRTTSLSEHRAL